ncbi:MAG: FlgD immunoglobulin-like domain containing protein, partial [Candidatus Krumholzibacteriia bacterium]
FDAVTASGTSVRIAQFTSPTGATGVYPYAAAIYNYVAASTARIVYLPYDLGYIYDSGTSTGVRPARADIMLNVLAFFGQLPGGPAVGVTPELAFAAKNYPNPFNPSTKIEFTLPRAGQVELKIYNVRGELVKTLLNETRNAGTQSVVWDGRSSTGGSVSSGVYFYSLKAGSYEKMEKMTLVK